MFELNILYALVPIKPAKAENDTVKSSGTEVAIPAIFPTVFGFKFKLSANFLKSFTKMYFDITTISNAYTTNFNNSNPKFVSIFPPYLAFLLLFAIIYGFIILYMEFFI